MTDLDGLIHDLLATDNIALMDDAAAALTRLRDRVTELEAALRTAEPAINSSYLQAIAEINMHDKVAARHDEIVQRSRLAIRAAIKKGDQQ